MEHKSYEESIKDVYKGLALLAGVTLVEVFFSLLGKGYIISGAENYRWLIIIASLAIWFYLFIKHTSSSMNLCT